MFACGAAFATSFSLSAEPFIVHNISRYYVKTSYDFSYLLYYNMYIYTHVGCIYIIAPKEWQNNSKTVPIDVNHTLDLFLLSPIDHGTSSHNSLVQ